MRYKTNLIYLCLFLLLVSSVTALQFYYDGASICINKNEWCGQGSNAIYEYIPSQGYIGGSNSSLTWSNVSTYNAEGEPLSFDFDVDGFVDLVYVKNNILYSYYWDGLRWRQQSIQTDNYSLAPYDLNVFEVDSGFVPDNNCYSNSNKYVFAQNGSSLFLFGINETDFCLAKETVIGTYEGQTIMTNNTLFKCAVDLSLGVFICVGAGQLYNSTWTGVNSTHSSITTFYYDYSNNNLTVGGVILENAFEDLAFRYYAELGDINTDGDLDFLFMNDEYNLKVYDIDGGLPIIKTYNTQGYLNDTINERFPCVDNARMPLIDYRIVEIEGSNLYPEIAITFLGSVGTEIYKQRLTVFYSDGTELTNFPIYYGVYTLDTGSHQGGCDEGTPSRIFQYNCYTGGITEDDLIIGYGGSGGVASGGHNKQGALCVNAYGDSFENNENVNTLGSIGNLKKSIMLGNYDGDEWLDVIVGSTIFELSRDTTEFIDLGSIKTLTNNDNLGLIHYDFSGDGYPDYLYTGSSTKLVSITTSNNASSNTLPFYFQTYYDTCSPVCVNNNVTFYPSFSDNEHNAVKFEIDCDGDGTYEITTDYINDYSTVTGMCNFSTVGLINVNFRLTDLYNTGSYVGDSVFFQVNTLGNCFESGEFDSTCILASDSSNITNESNEYGINESQYAYTPVFDGYSASGFDWSKCSGYTIMRPFCPLWLWFKGGMEKLFSSFWTYFTISLMLLLILSVYAVVRRNKK